MKMQTYNRLKRALDIAASAVGLFLSAPLLVIVALAIRVNYGSPVFFRQSRPGKHGQPFTLVKFRTMLKPDEDKGHVTDADRLTHLGRVLRSASLDELPTLWNVLRGNMSLVGPRPLLPEYLPLYSPRQALRHTVLPGITGLAQVNGRNELDWSERLELDVRYVESRTLRLDLRILLATIATVIRHEGISKDGHATMTHFDGRITETSAKEPEQP